MKWNKVKTILPKCGLEVLGYCKDWIDLDFNVEGVRLCYLADEGIWYSTGWSFCQDVWTTTSTIQPTHWRYKPLPPKSIKHCWNCNSSKVVRGEGVKCRYGYEIEGKIEMPCEGKLYTKQP